MSILKKLNQPFPIGSSVKSKFGMAVFFGLFVFIFLIIFKPFELNRFKFFDMLLIDLVYGSITFGCVFTGSALLPILFPAIFFEKNWTTGKQIIFILIIILLVGMVNYVVSPLMVDTSLNGYNLLWFQGITVAIGLIPISIFFLMRQNQLLKKFSGEADIIEQRLLEKNSVEMKLPVSNKITIIGDYQDEHLEIFADDLYVIASASNYIKLFHLQHEKLLYTILRSTLKKAETQALSYSNFFKCHRAFIINLDKVEHVEGNAQGYKVKIKSYDELIPVSRNLNSEFSDKLLAFRNLIGMKISE